MKTVFPCLALIVLAACQSPEERAFEKQTPDSASLDSASTTQFDDSIAADKQSLNSINNSDELMNESDLDDASAAFMKQAAAGSLYEIRLGRLPSGRSPNTEVANLGMVLEKDHGRIRKQLEDLSTRMGVILPATLPQEQQEAIGRLEKLKGGDFDASYLKILEGEHQKAITLYSDAAANSRSKAVTDFARRYISTLKNHAAMIRRLQ